jgi:folate-binding protein YgfZ
VRGFRIIAGAFVDRAASRIPGDIARAIPGDAIKLVQRKLITARPLVTGVMRRLPLRALHELGGAVFTEMAGWEVPASYSEGDAEVRTTRAAAGVIDHSDRTKVRITGPDRVSFLNGLVTQDVAVLKPGEHTYTLILNPKAKVIGDAWVYGLQGAYLLDLLANEASRVLDHIQKHLISDDVTIEVLPSAAHLELHGPAAPGLVRRLLGGARGPDPGHFTEIPVDPKRSFLLASSDYLRLPGFRFISWTDSLYDVWRRLTASGPPTLGNGATPIGREAWNTLRIEAGRPLVGVDMDENTIALEARMESAISFTKGCYEGQEVIARATYQGHMNRLLVGFRVEGDTVPVRGDAVLVDGKQVGNVTSATYSPIQRYVIALGYVRRPNDATGTRLQIQTDGWQLRGSVAELPFAKAAIPVRAG